MVRAFKNAKSLDGRDLSFTIEDGRFQSFGSLPSEEGAVAEDCGGATVLPGFVDAHCHILPTGLDLQKLNLSGCGSRDEVLQAVKEWGDGHPEGWLLAVHYDQTRFDDGVHLTRFELNRVVDDRPVILRHANGHASVANSKAFEVAGIPDDVSDPTGGTFVRDAAGRLTGVLLERAHEAVTARAPEPTLEEMTEAILRAGEKMASLGVTCATDMMTGRWNLERELTAYRNASEQGCRVRLRMFAQWGSVLGPRRIDQGRLKEILHTMDPAKCRLEGLKIFADGAIGSATAAIYGKFLTTGGDGQLIYAPERFTEMVSTADKAGYRLAVHTIGDRSTDLVLSAYERTEDPARHRTEHAMLLSNEQIQRLRDLGGFVTMQPEFLLRFGHAYLKQLGPERAFSLKRVRTVMEAGIRLSFSSDRPIVPGDPWDGIRCAVQRPEGFDPAENVSLPDAVRLYTFEAALANGDRDQGNLEAGFRADFQSYSGVPGEGPPTAVFVGGQQTV